MFPPIRPRPTKPSFVVVSATSAAADDRDEPERALDLQAGLAERGPLQPCLLHRLSFASEVRGALSLCLHRQPVSQSPAAWNLRLAASFSAKREPVAGEAMHAWPGDMSTRRAPDVRSGRPESPASG